MLNHRDRKACWEDMVLSGYDILHHLTFKHSVLENVPIEEVLSESPSVKCLIQVSLPFLYSQNLSPNFLV